MDNFLPVSPRTDTSPWTARKWSVIPICLSLAILESLVVGARLWTRGIIQKTWGLEDWLISIALFFSLFLLGGVILAVDVFGYSEHTDQLSTSQLVLAAEWLFVGEFFYIITTCLIKVAILLFYRRLAERKTGKAFVYTLYVVMADIITYKIIYLIVILRTCLPLKARWLRVDPTWALSHQYTCINEGLNLLVGSTISSTEDLVIALLPTLLFWNLKMPRRQKVALWSLFAISIFTSVAGLVRSYYIYRAYWTTADYIWEQYWLWICSAVEITIGLICSSAPALKPFFAYHRTGPRLRSLLRPVTRHFFQKTSSPTTSSTPQAYRSSTPNAYRSSTPNDYRHSEMCVFDGANATTVSEGRATWKPATAASRAVSAVRNSEDAGAGFDFVAGLEKRGLGRRAEEREKEKPDDMFITVTSDIEVDEVDERPRVWEGEPGRGREDRWERLEGLEDR